MSFKGVIGWLFIFVIGSIIVSAILDPSILNDIGNRIRTFTGSVSQNSVLAEQDSLISQCLKSFNECEKITETKYDSVYITLIKAEKFEDENNAQTFFDMWKGPTQMYRYDFYWSNIQYQYPLILIAAKIKGPIGETPLVIPCDKEGQLLAGSKSILLCG